MVAEPVAAEDEMDDMSTKGSCCQSPRSMVQTPTTKIRIVSCYGNRPCVSPCNMDFYTSVSVLSVAGGYVVWLWAVIYLRILQYRENEATIFRRETCQWHNGCSLPCPLSTRCNQLFRPCFQLTRSSWHIFLILVATNSISITRGIGTTSWYVRTAGEFDRQDILFTSSRWFSCFCVETQNAASFQYRA
jgi:hypothetical protein